MTPVLRDKYHMMTTGIEIMVVLPSCVLYHLQRSYDHVTLETTRCLKKKYDGAKFQPCMSNVTNKVMNLRGMVGQTGLG